jgi:hypothetical protein
MRTICIALIALALTIAACGPPSPSNSSFGTIAGYVTDTMLSEPVVGATVMLMGTNLGAITSEYGYYEVRHVPPGTYPIRVSCVAYEPATVEHVVVYANRITWQEVPLNQSPQDLNLSK